MTKRYLVTWAIDIEDAEDPEAAAREADAHYRREGSIAHVFEVQEQDDSGKAFGPIEVVDLDELDGNPEA